MNATEHIKTATELIDEVREEICNDYCRFTEKALDALDNAELLETICGKCPLNKL